MIPRLFSEQVTRVCIALIAVILTFAAMQYAQAILVPMALAVTLGIVVSPVDEWLRKGGLLPALSALLLLLLSTALVAALVILLQPLVASLIGRLPELQSALSDWIATLRDVLRGVEEVSEEIQKTVSGEEEASLGAAVSPIAPVAPVALMEAPAREGAMWSITDALWMAPNFAASLLIFVGTFFFFTLTRREIYRAAGDFEATLLRADHQVSVYFVAVSIVNAGVGLATGLAMALLGVEHALLWGLAAGFLNYVLYLGPIIIAFGLMLAGLIQFGGALAFLPPAAFVLINVTEAQFVTPLFVGQRVNLNPLVVFLAIVFGLWLWGPLGAILALPMLLWVTLLASDAARPKDLPKDLEKMRAA